MREPTHAPYIQSHRGRRAYGLNSVQAGRLKADGDIWLSHRNGIVVYLNTAIDETDEILPRIWVTPRDLSIPILPGYWPPPDSFTDREVPGTWVAHEWLRDPKKLPSGDPKIARILWLRRRFYEIKRGHRTGRHRAFDIWPQPENSGPIWPWEPKRFKLPTSKPK